MLRLNVCEINERFWTLANKGAELGAKQPVNNADRMQGE